MDEENDALKVRHVTVEIKCDAFDSVENENNTENNEKKKKNTNRCEENGQRLENSREQTVADDVDVQRTHPEC